MSNLSQTADNSLYTLQLASTLESLQEVERFVDEICTKYQVDEETFAIMMTCLSEIVTNAIIHGNKNDLNKKVIINLEVVNNKKMLFTISDEGTGFDVHNLPDATDVSDPEQMNGRGLYIVTNLADQCVFNGIGNEVELHFKI